MREIPPCELDAIITLHNHPRDCAFMKAYCRECGYIGNTEMVDQFPPCPRRAPRKETP